MGNYNIEHWLFFFFLFTMIGWVQESIIESVYHKKLINRGFLKGPYIPVYGFGGCIILLCCLPFKYNGFLVFLVGMLSCTALEFITGTLMEKAFNKQFWDYSMLKLTYKNRISLVSSLFWGVLSLFMVYILHGFARSFVLWLNDTAVWTYIIIMAVAMSVDIVYSIKANINLHNLSHKLPYEQFKVLFHKRRLQTGFRFFRWDNVLVPPVELADNDDCEQTEVKNV